MSEWNTDLIRRYDGKGPRYTSYPPALAFHEEISETDYRDAIDEGNAARRPLSLYSHIPFCQSVCYYCACNRIVTANRQRGAEYLDDLLSEMRYRAATLDGQRPVTQLHWGGGTPTFLDDGQLTRLMHHTGRLFRLLEDDRGDYGIELDPRTVDRARIGLLRGLGFNRASLGVQDLDPRVQQAVNRVQSLGLISDTMAALREFEFHSVSVDLIYGLPWQSESSLARTVEQLVALNPDRVSLYNYAHLPARFKVQKQIEEAALPAPSEKLRMLARAGSLFEQAGYQLIGMDHFARPHDALAQAQQAGRLHRNFQGYSLHGDADLLGMGVSAISQIGGLYAQNFKQHDRWQASVQAGELPMERGFLLNRDDLIRRDVIMTLLCDMALDYAALGEKWSVPIPAYFARELMALEPMEQDGLLQRHADRLVITERGRLFARAVAMCFDLYSGQAPEQHRYSRII
ncbi:MAG: oxygen-independent coproporphyrinogen III oxidase [Alcanivorax sp.]|nr:oxygen-independent coproporphyrinogen III oxidase [Alcanivorax sp.]